jgi:hypothetical protein
VVSRAMSSRSVMARGLPFVGDGRRWCGQGTASHGAGGAAVCGRFPLLAVARNLGHADTRMVERHYGHLAPSFITEAIHAGAPHYGIKAPKRVVPLRQARAAARHSRAPAATQRHAASLVALL